MKSSKRNNLKEKWEVPQIDLNPRHYSGSPSDVIKEMKMQIERYLTLNDVSEETKNAYSAVYNALNYYKSITYMPSASFETEDTFLEQTLASFNSDYKYLSEKYNSAVSYDTPVITMKGRIKSPLSFINKVKEKITEYVDEGNDLQYFNESLRDVIGMRIIIDPPEEIKKQGLKAESDFLYQVTYDLITHKHGLDNKEDRDLKLGEYKFLPVNTRFHPHKQQDMENKKITLINDLVKRMSENPPSFYIPDKRPNYIENISEIIKDYNQNPKERGYQSLHTCVSPYYANTTEDIPLPKCIVPPSDLKYAFEYQFRTRKQDDIAEHGPASHTGNYKPVSKIVHRLAIPYYIDFLPDDDLIQNSYDSKTGRKKELDYNNKKLVITNLGESFQKYYGMSFELYYGIPFKLFRDMFTSCERDNILANKSFLDLDEETGLYNIQPIDFSVKQIPTFFDKDEIKEITSYFKNNLINKVKELLDKKYVTDNIKTPTIIDIDSKPKMHTKMYTLIKEAIKTKRKEKIPHILDNKKNIDQER